LKDPPKEEEHEEQHQEEQEEKAERQDARQTKLMRQTNKVIHDGVLGDKIELDPCPLPMALGLPSVG
jgi:hypothetical protein